MEGENFYVEAVGTSDSFTDRFLYVEYMGENNESLGISQSVNIRYAWNLYYSAYSLNGSIPAGTKKIRFYGNKTSVAVADIYNKN